MAFDLAEVDQSKTASALGNPQCGMVFDLYEKNKQVGSVSVVAMLGERVAVKEKRGKARPLYRIFLNPAALVAAYRVSQSSYSVLLRT